MLVTSGERGVPRKSVGSSKTPQWMIDCSGGILVLVSRSMEGQ
jgi:hypothetical protein